MSSSPAQGSGKERPTRKKPAGFYVKGQQVVARFKGRSLYPGRIKDAQLFTKTYTVEYDDGDVEENVPLVSSVQPVRCREVSLRNILSDVSVRVSSLP